MPFERGRAPTSRPTLAPSKASFGVGGDVDRLQQREGAVVELHRDALGGLEGRLDLQQLQPIGSSGPSSWPEAIRKRSA